MSKTDAALGVAVNNYLETMGVQTPMNKNQHLSSDEKIRVIWEAMETILSTLGLDLNDDSLADTPSRVAKMYVNELYWGLDPLKFPKCTTVDNKMGYDEMVIEKNIKVMSDCFVAGTMVETPKGRVPIERIKAGDWVYSMNAEHLLELKQAATDGVLINDNSKLVEVYTDDGTVICTPDHRFYTNNKGWIAAGDLEAGDSVTSLYRGASTQYKANGRSHLNSNSNAKSAKNRNKLKIPYGMDNMDEAKIVYCMHHSVVPSKIRYLTIHHENEISSDNRPENLTLMSTADHNREHKRTEKFEDLEYRKARVTEGTTEVSLEKRSKSVANHWANMSKPEYEARCVAMSSGITASRNHKIIGVRELDYTAPTYCFEVPDNHNFFVNGMCVHNCEHHLRTIVGVAHVAYIPKNKVLGLSKLNRIVDYFSRRPQIQERLAEQIYHALAFILETANIAVVIEAEHFCVKQRGIQDVGSSTITSKLGGDFREIPAVRAEFMNLIK